MEALNNTRGAPMGMYDDVICECDLPHAVNSHLDREFQTKSLCRMLDRFTITKEGRLIHHSFRYVEVKTPEDPLLPFRMVPVDPKDIDMEFHGDIRLNGEKDGKARDYIVRFTHGTVEWIRPIEMFSEKQRTLIDSRSLEDQ
jgi:hypothetical protein